MHLSNTYFFQGGIKKPNQFGQDDISICLLKSSPKLKDRQESVPEWRRFLLSKLKIQRRLDETSLPQNPQSITYG